MILMGMLHDDLDDLDRGSLEALAGSLMGAGESDVPRFNRAKRKLGFGKTRQFKWENLEGVGLNQTVKVEIELPGYYVAAMARDPNGYREAVRDYLVRNGRTWWYPRFLVALKAKEIEAANRRFTRGLR